MIDRDLIWYSAAHAFIWITTIFIHVGVNSRFNTADYFLRNDHFLNSYEPKIKVTVSPEVEWTILFWAQLSLLILLQILNVVLLKVSKFVSKSSYLVKT